MTQEYNVKPEEAKFLMEIEQLIGGPLPDLNKPEYQEPTRKFVGVEVEEFGYKTEGDTIVGLGLYECGLITLPESIRKLKSLQRLNLSFNNLNSLPESIGELNSLQILYANGNKITDLPESIGNLKKISILELNENKIEIIPETIGNLTSLRFLELRKNALIELPDSIGNLITLEILNLDSNHLNTLPKSIGNLRSLYCLYLTGNPLESLPPSIGNLEKIHTLQVNSCQLSFLPKSIGNLRSIKTLDLRYNKLQKLPDSIGNLRSLESLYLNNNYLTALPMALFSEEFPQILNKDKLSTNSFHRKFIDECKSHVLKVKGRELDYLMKIIEICEDEVVDVREPFREKLRENFLPLLYAGSIASVGLLTFLIIGLSSQNIDLTILWLLFIGAILINLLIGASIISTLSGYLKKYIEPLIEERQKLRKRIFGFFDVFVLFYLVWSIRAAVKTMLDVELIPSVDFVFEYTFPDWFFNIWAFFGYNIDLTFLENLDLFLGHFFLKLFGIALVFWALYRNGLSYIKKTAFEGKEDKRLWPFLILGLFGAFSLAMMEFSTLEGLLSIGYSFGAIIGCCLFIWETNKKSPSVFLIYLSIIIFGILIVWLLSLWNLILSFIIVVILIIVFFLVRRKVELSKSFIKYDIDPKQARALKELQLFLKKPIPDTEDIGYDYSFGVKIIGTEVVALALSECDLKSIPEIIGDLSSIEELHLENNELTRLPESIGRLTSLKVLSVRHNRLKTLPDSIGNLKSLQKLHVKENLLETIPESILKLSSLQRLVLSDNNLIKNPDEKTKSIIQQLKNRQVHVIMD